MIAAAQRTIALTLKEHESRNRLGLLGISFRAVLDIGPCGDICLTQRPGTTHIYDFVGKSRVNNFLAALGRRNVYRTYPHSGSESC